MSYSNKRRFVAGAVCPKCAVMDKLLVFREDDEDFRECVACGFKEKMFFKPLARELDTRVNASEEQKEQETQVLEFLPSEKK